MTLGEFMSLAAVFAGGTGFTTILNIWWERRKGISEARRSEVDTIARQLAASQAAESQAARDCRVALELLSATRRAAIDAGVPLSALPPVEI